MTGVYCIVFNMEIPSYSQDRTPAKTPILVKTPFRINANAIQTTGKAMSSRITLKGLCLGI